MDNLNVSTKCTLSFSLSAISLFHHHRLPMTQICFENDAKAIARMIPLRFSRYLSTWEKVIIIFYFIFVWSVEVKTHKEVHELVRFF